MAKQTRARSNILGLMAIGVLSAGSMVWLFWHYPFGTSLATIVVLVAFAISARLARMIETDGRPSDMARNKRHF